MNNSNANVLCWLLTLFYTHSSRLLIIFIALMVLPLSLRAEENNIGTWLVMKKSGQAIQDKRFKYFLALQGRWLNDDNASNEGLLRAGGGYTIRQNLTGWIGCLLSSTSSNDDDERRYEQRLWQRFVIDMIATPRFALSSSSQLEQRVQVNQTDVAVRFRQKAIVVFPRLFSSPFFPLVSEELFFNINHPQWVNDHFIAQNRVFIGSKIFLPSHYAIQVGYLNQVEFSQITIVNHIVSLTLLL